ncbi:FAD/NAD(P)-binding protein [Saccharothrix sp. ST-888]|uniref:FAD/NAD(P)-binding protein n=1 Tax=Saccharothrix sp. ST-888 TaxID=1427391 RepID=UPI0007C63984|nr:FAD/NAD(P)-binding protein [Saccharothrix sp. ST-888]
MPETPRIAVVGAGAAGTLTAAQLLRRAAALQAELEVWLIDPGATGRGVAYASSAAHHLLNVPAGRMSAYHDAPDHFVRWLTRRAPGVHAGDDHVPRALYGEYLADVLAAAASGPGPGRLHRVHERAVGVRRTDHGVTLVLGSDEPVSADAAVLALGNFPPGSAWAPPALHRSSRYLPDPWAPGALADLPDHGDVLLVGTGLTMVDVALTLSCAGRAVRAISRHGLLPQPHAESPLPVAPPPSFDSGADIQQIRRSLLSHVSACRRTYGDWRVGIDSLRPVTAELWRHLSPSARAHFLHHDQTLWNSHRHRIPPTSARALRDEIDAGRIQVGPGEIADAAAAQDSVLVRLRDGRTLSVGAVVNCTGPQADVRRVDDPLVAGLLATGLAAPDPTGLGFHTTPNGRLRPADGTASAVLWTLGSLRRGALFESTAIPEIRAQAHALAADLLGSKNAGRRGGSPGLHMSLSPGKSSSQVG